MPIRFQYAEDNPPTLCMIMHRVCGGWRGRASIVVDLESTNALLGDNDNGHDGNGDTVIGILKIEY